MEKNNVYPHLARLKKELEINRSAIKAGLETLSFTEMRILFTHGLDICNDIEKYSADTRKYDLVKSRK